MARSGWTSRRLTCLVALVMVVLLLAGVAPTAAAQPADESTVVDWWDDLQDAESTGDPEAPPVAAAELAPVAEDVPVDPATVTLPQPETVDVSLGSAGDPAAVGDAPIELAPASAASAGEDLQVEVLDREATEPVASGFAFRVSGSGGEALTEAVDGSLPVEVSIDYAGFEGMYGAGYGERLQVVALPECALQGPPFPAGCDTSGVPLETVNNVETSTLTVEVDDLTALDAATLASDEPELAPPVQADDVTAPESSAAADETTDPASVTDPPAAETPTGRSDTGESPPDPDDTPSTSTTAPTTTTSSTTAPAPAAGSTTTVTEAAAAEDTETGSSGGAETEQAASSTTSTSSSTSSSTTTSTTSPTTSTTPQENEQVPPAGESGADEPADTEAAPDELAALPSGGAVLAVTSAVAGESGNLGATPFGVSSDWQVGVGSGEFNWSYDVPVPPAPTGETPGVSLGYSSGSVDGMTNARNTQAGDVGLGWGGPAGGFIERRYAPCAEGEVYRDLCWRSDNAVISLNGVSDELVPVEGGAFETWVLRNDPNWRVERSVFPVNNGDNNNENWIVTTPDGTKYYFGLGSSPSGAATNSVWTVPVFGNDPGEPCRTLAGELGWCNQAWRWNLDRVQDPNGNITTFSYLKGVNQYGLLNGWEDVTYNHHGRLAGIYYGWHEDNIAAGPSARVEFGNGYRCVTFSETCDPPNPSNGDQYPDVPNDLICRPGIDTDCQIISPTFFSTGRYTEIRTAARASGGGWAEADVVRLTHTFLDNGEGSRKLGLLNIQRFGKVGLPSNENLPLPPVNFGYELLHNRVDYNATRPAMEHHRLDVVSDEYGRQIRVTYGRPNGCTPGTNPRPNGDWDLNNQTCFPQTITRPDGTTGTGVFHKWLVTEVEERDLVGGSASMISAYNYGGTPAWHHDDDEFVQASQQTWSDWRGYGTVRVTRGDSATRYRIFRGMDGDRLRPIPGDQRRDVDISSFDGTVTVPDDNWLAGRVLDQEQGSVVGTGEVTPMVRLLTEYHAQVTSDWGGEPQDDAHWVGVRRVTESRATPGAGWVRRRTTTEVDASFRPHRVYEEGWLDQTGDERCSRTAYATNTSAMMLDYPSAQVMVEGDCASTTELRRTEWYYDGGALHAAPTNGNVTQTRSRRSSTAWGGFTTTTYDPLGRPITVTDPLNHATTTAYSPAFGIPTQTTVTNARNHTATTTWQPERGVPLVETDPNGHVTRHRYDALGREDRVWSASDQEPGVYSSVRLDYYVDPEKDAPPTIRTRRALDDAGTRFEDSWVIYDGFGRERQTHTLSPGAGKAIVESTSYDGRGNVATQAGPEPVTGTAGSGILRPANDAPWANLTRMTYDALDRVVNTEVFAAGSESWEATTSYTHFTTTVLPPRGGATVSTTDAYDRTVTVSEQTSRGGTDWADTHYDYNLAGDLLSMTDPSGNEITYQYDMLGQRISQSDPDAGDWSFTYDAAGNQTSVTDAGGTTVHTLYDELNRPTERRRDTTTGPLLASWDYDATGQAGLLDKTTRHTSSGDWVIDVTGYDERNRPTGRTWTVPSGVTGLSGSYHVGYTYDRVDHVATVSYPAVGGLPAETVTTDYNTLGLPTTMASSLETYVGVTGYDDRGRPALFGYGDTAAGGDFPMGRIWTYDSQQRLQTTETAGHGGQLVSEHTLGYDSTGNVTERVSNLNGNEYRECYSYDARNRLTLATTTADVTNSNACASAPGSPSGDLAYRESYSYTKDGRLSAVTRDGVTRDYTYPSGAEPGPRHAPTAVEGDTYTWDANGQLESRTVEGEETTFEWDAERRLESITSDAGTARFTYDPDGQRLLHQAPSGDRTLYIEGHEITASDGGATVQATRVYGFGGALIATRTASGVDYLGVNEQGSLETQTPDGSAAPDATQAYTPYGTRRTSDDFDTQRGWIGQIEDDDTGLSYLNARYYDANIGVFISPDPIVDPAQPATLNPYAYAYGNPTTLSDETGLRVPVSNSNRPTVFYTSQLYGGLGGFSGNPYNDVGHNGLTRRQADRIHRVQVHTRRTYQNVVRNPRAYPLHRMFMDNPHPGFWRALAAAGSAAGLIQRGLRAANSDPGFWRALAAAGSPGGLILGGLRAANPDPGFWRFIHAIGDPETARAIGRLWWAISPEGAFSPENMDAVRRSNRSRERELPPMDPEVAERFMGAGPNPECLGDPVEVAFINPPHCYAPAPDVPSFTDTLREVGSFYWDAAARGFQCVETGGQAALAAGSAATAYTGDVRVGAAAGAAGGIAGCGWGVFVDPNPPGFP